MSITSKWCHHIEKWQNSGLTQAEYCLQQQINVRTFTVKYRKLSAIDSVALVPVQLESTQSPASLPAPMTAAMVFTHVHDHRLELSSSVSASWVAELLLCLA